MKKLLSIFLILPFLFFSTSCAEGKIQYKTVTFKHAEILQEQLELTFPNDWIYEEICDGNNLIKFYSYEDYTEIGNVTINQFYNSKSGFYENRKELVPLKDATYNKINEDCFIATDKGKGNIICYRINDVEAIDIFINILAEKKTVKNIAKNIISTKIEIDKNTHSEVQATEQKISAVFLNHIQAPPRRNFAKIPCKNERMILSEKGKTAFMVYYTHRLYLVQYNIYCDIG